MTVRSCNILGPLKLASKRSLWPIISQVADRLYSKRLALIGETAHVVPPIGAQGLNMSIADIKFLSDLDQKYPDQLGSIDTLIAPSKAPEKTITEFDKVCLATIPMVR